MESCSQDLLVGAASVPINPPLGLPLIGYPSNRPNTGVALDLCLRAALWGISAPRPRCVKADTRPRARSPTTSSAPSSPRRAGP